MAEEMTHQAVCIQQQQIGEIKASLQSRKEENQKIEGQLTTMVSMLTTSQLDQAKRDNELKNELVKIATVLQGEQERRKEFERERDVQKNDIIKLQTDVAEINNNIKHLLGLNNDSVDVHDQFEKRIKYLEHVSIWVYAVGFVIVAIAAAIGYLITTMVGIKDLVDSREKKEYHQVQRVEDHSSTTTTTTQRR